MLSLTPCSRAFCGGRIKTGHVAPEKSGNGFLYRNFEPCNFFRFAELWICKDYVRKCSSSSLISDRESRNFKCLI